jgi:hypothetical protein
MRTTCRNIEYARAAAWLFLATGIMCGLVWHANLGAAAHGGHALSCLLWWALACVGLAVPLYFGVLVVFYGVSAVSFAAGLWLAVASFLTAPFPWWIVNWLVVVPMVWLPVWLLYAAEKKDTFRGRAARAPRELPPKGTF